MPGSDDGCGRPVAGHVRAEACEGRASVTEAGWVLAMCSQHEMNHLMGKGCVEYLSPLKRNRIKAKMLKAQREAARA